MPREKGRPGHASIQDASDLTVKYQRISKLFEVSEHLRHGLEFLPDYFGLSDVLNDAVDYVVLDIMDSPAGSAVNVSHLFRAVLETSAQVGENSIHNYRPYVPPEVVRVWEIRLDRNGYVALVDAQDYENVRQYIWSASLDREPVAQRKLDGPGRKVTIQTMHDFLMNPPKGTKVEHINGNGLDNRRENLRLVSNGPETP
jgi:hypothetical protein